MENSPKVKENVENIIKDYFSEQPALDSVLAKQNKRALPGTIIFHKDGTWTEAGGCQDTPEKLSKINSGNVKPEDSSYTQLYYRNSSNKNWSSVMVNTNNIKSTNATANSTSDMRNQLLQQFMSTMLLSTLGNNSSSSYAMLRSNLMAYSLYNNSTNSL
jgi:hypothetical protein